MGLQDITRQAVLDAVAEFDSAGRDAFLERYGFGEAREFWLEHEGRRYDSKAIVGAAHGYLQGRSPLSAEDFSGGNETVVPRLEALGFEVAVERLRDYHWSRQETLLALDVYVRAGCDSGATVPGKSSLQVRELSRLLNDLRIHPVAGRKPQFRNPNGVAQKLLNLREAQRQVGIARGAPGAETLPRGREHTSQLDAAVMDEFWDRWDEVAEEAERIRQAASQSAADAKGALASIEPVPVEGTHTATYEAAAPGGGQRTRSESVLRDRYVAAMREAGHEVGGYHYRIEGEAYALRCDVFIEDLNLLVEAKASDDRGSIRYAIGQLFDYALRHAEKPRLAVLVPYEPRADLVRLLDSVDVGCVWPRRSGGFADNRRGELTP